MTLPTPQLVEQALAGDRAALRMLLERVAPIIQARAARALARRSGASGRDARQELMDMTQEVFVSLLENEGRCLRAWRAERKLSFENFVGLIADRQVVTILRTGKRSPWKEDPVEDEALEAHVGDHAGEAPAIASRELLVGVLDRLRQELSAKMLRLFYALWIEDAPIASVCEELGMQTEAVYTARSRIAKRARAIAEELSGSPMSTRIPQEES